MRVALVCPAPPGSRVGNRITALRWRRMLRELGHDAFLARPGRAPPCDLLIALHARRSAESVRSARELQPDRPLVVALTGTDLYRDIHVDADAQRSLELADRLIGLHGAAAEELPRRFRSKVRVVPQSAQVPVVKPAAPNGMFQVAVVGHLRPEKDPLRTALAARRLNGSSKLVVVHAGTALSKEMRADALREMRVNSRYRWLGELPPWKARQLIARSHALSVTSRIEGGANVVSEAIAAGTPVIASRIPAMRAILGAGYPALFPVGDAAALARLLRRAEEDRAFLADLRRRCVALRPSLSPPREKAALRELLAELGPRVRRS